MTGNLNMGRSLTRDMQRRGGRIARNLNIVFRAERIIARRRLAVVRTQTGLMLFAGLIAAIGIAMISLAAFFWFAERHGNAMAGLIVAGIDFAIALVLVLVATRMSSEPELQPMIEVRDIALGDIEAEAEDALDEVRDIADGIRAISRDPLGIAGQSLLGPLVSVLVKSLRK